MPVETEQSTAKPDESGFRRGVRATLIYFGLAEEEGKAERARDPRRLLADTAFIALLLPGLVGDHRGATTGWILAACFVPALLAGVLRAVGRDVDEKIDTRLSIVPMMAGLALWTVPRHTALWIPLAIAAALSLLLLAADLRRDSAR